jgi:Cu(I)/Ag(I) efflux system membrane fusion protein
MIDITEEFSTALLRQYYVIECPMAFDNTGARWLQTDKTVRNPYFGSSMFKCGEVVKQIPEE